MKKYIFIPLLVLAVALCISSCKYIEGDLDIEQNDSIHEHVGGTATCTKQAQCEICNEFYGEKAAHDYKTATCTAPYVCKVCRNIKGTALGHSFTTATCVADSVCEKCNLVNGKAYGHTYSEWTVIEQATCSDDGKKSRACDCGYADVQIIPSIGHTFGEWTVIENATCTDSGMETSVCTLCEKSEEKIIAATGHRFGKWTTIQDATYFEIGSKMRSCSCGECETADIPCLSKLFEDDFAGEYLDNRKWEKCPEWDRQGGASKWNNDMSYLDGNGHLVIRAEWDEENDRVVCGGVRTEGLFAGGYGYYEASIKFSVAEGVWGAFWIQCGNVNNVDGSAKDGVEIDVIESIHNENGVFNSALHYDGYGKDHVQVHSGYLSKIDIYDGNFHTFAVERNEKGYIFYVDGIETWRVSSSACDPCPELGYLKLTVEAAEWAGSGSNSCIDALPIEMLVDYVRVYPENPYV